MTALDSQFQQIEGGHRPPLQWRRLSAAQDL